MKVYVVTAYAPLQPEQYVAVRRSRREAERVIRREFPNAREVEPGTFLCRQEGRERFMAIREEELT